MSYDCDYNEVDDSDDGNDDCNDDGNDDGNKDGNENGKNEDLDKSPQCCAFSARPDPTPGFVC